MIPMDDSGRFSLLRLRNMYNGNHAFVLKTATIFLSQFEQDLSAINEKLASGDFQEVKLLAHKIKPNIDLFQIIELQEPIREIERNAEEQNQEVLVKLVKNLAQVYTEIACEMRQVIDKS